MMLTLLAVGFYMHSLAYSPFKIELYGLHKSFGMLVLMLAGVRILWRAATSYPPEIDTHKAWEKSLSKLIHIVLYVAMIGMPLSGWLMSSAGDFPASFFGLFEWPDLVSKDKTLFDLFKEAHEIFAFALIGAVTLHMAGAFKHHFIDSDVTLKRMSTMRLGVMGGIMVLLISGLLYGAALFFPVTKALGLSAKEQSHTETSAAQNSAAPKSLKTSAHDNWSILTESSAIDFTATQYGQNFAGTFPILKGQIQFDPENMRGNNAHIEVDLSAIETGSDDRNQQAKTKDWFDVENYPVAVFKSTDFQKTKPNHYVANGTLTLKNVTLPLALPFRLEIEDQDNKTQRATMHASLEIARLDYGIGQGEWASAETIGNTVTLDIQLDAQRVLP